MSPYFRGFKDGEDNHDQKDLEGDMKVEIIWKVGRLVHGWEEASLLRNSTSI